MLSATIFLYGIIRLCKLAAANNSETIEMGCLQWEEENKLKLFLLL